MEGSAGSNGSAEGVGVGSPVGEAVGAFVGVGVGSEEVYSGIRSDVYLAFLSSAKGYAVEESIVHTLLKSNPEYALWEAKEASGMAVP